MTKTIYNNIPDLPVGVTVTGVSWKVNESPDFTGTMILSDLNSVEHKVKTITYNFKPNKPIFAEVITHLSTGDITSGLLTIYDDTVIDGNAPISYAPKISLTHFDGNLVVNFEPPKFFDTAVVYTGITLTLTDLGHRPFFEYGLDITDTSFTLTEEDFNSRPSFIVEVSYSTSSGVSSPIGRELVITNIDKTYNDPALESYEISHDRTTLIKVQHGNKVSDGSTASYYYGYAMFRDSDYSTTVTVSNNDKSKKHTLTHIGDKWKYETNGAVSISKLTHFEHNGNVFESNYNSNFVSNGITYKANLPDSKFTGKGIIQVNENTVLLTDYSSTSNSFETYLIDIVGTTINFIQLASYQDTRVVTFNQTVVDDTVTIGDSVIDIYTGKPVKSIPFYDNLQLKNVQAKKGVKDFDIINPVTKAKTTYTTPNKITTLHWDGTNVIVYPSSGTGYIVKPDGTVKPDTRVTATNYQIKSTKHQFS